MSTVAASPMAQQVEKLLKVALDNGATELRLSGGVAPMLRINDQMRPLKTKALPAEEIEAMASAEVTGAPSCQSSPSRNVNV